jgi:TRAP-type C4-dicarboxylate transport system permease small subunit
MRDRTFVEQIIGWIERIAAVTLGLVTVLIVVSSVGRYGFAKPVPDVFDISRLILGIAIIWGFASLGYRGSHIKVDLFASVMGNRARRWMNGFAWSVLLLFTCLLTWKIFERVMGAYASSDSTFELRLPHWPFLAALWLGLVAALFTTVVRLYRVIAHGHDLDGFEDVEALVKPDVKPDGNRNEQ